MAKSSNGQDVLHVFFFPFFAPSHIVTLVDMAKLFAERPGVRVSLVTSPANAFYFRRAIDDSARRGHPMDLLFIPFPSAEVGLPEGCESTANLPPLESTLTKYYKAVALLRHPFEKLIHEHRPDCIVSDASYVWTSDLGIPTLIYESGFPFHLSVQRSLADAVLSGSSIDDDDNIVAGGLPHRIELMRSELPMILKKYPQSVSFFKESESKSYGVVVNSFDELTPEYVEHYSCKVLGRGRRLWCLGPLWLCNRSDADHTGRGGGSNSESWDMMRSSWLDSQDQGSVLYVCFGSELNVLSHDQLHEIALGLESSGHRFLWVVKDDQHTGKAEWLPERYEERLKGEGKSVIFRGWAPQMQALNHPAIGGFLTHCGCNSTVEAVSAGVPMLGWPLLWDQFINERMIVEVLGIGVRVLEGSARTEGLEKVIVKAEVVSAAVSKLMGDGEEAMAMRKRVEEYKVMARSAMEEGGSSHANLSQLIQELTVLAKEK